MTNEQIAASIEKLTQQLSKLAEAVRAKDDAPTGKIQPPESALEKMRAGICLQCDQPAAPGRRGLCEADYGAVRRRILDRKITEAAAIKGGYILPKNLTPSGRPSKVKPIDVYINSAESESEAKVTQVVRGKVRDASKRKAKK
jgi:hypothetical protein